jgi:hypothetical protein
MIARPAFFSFVCFFYGIEDSKFFPFKLLVFLTHRRQADGPSRGFLNIKQEGLEGENMAPNACSTLFDLKDRMAGAGKTATPGWYSLETSISLLSKASNGKFNCLL